ncbi:DUF5753 domain-containing protein [Saccharopolyspora cebuensis]|uniref:DUF5753 domain-containing protein n=1 Tax=Saccharopolyspora cebuensis TaxID=418759 RepID=A0ABV4CNT7_9PSEU
MPLTQQESPGGAAVMADQLRHILDVADQPNITVHVLAGGATSWHPAHAGPFMLFDFRKEPSIVHLEHLSSSAFLYAPGDVRVYSDAVANLTRLAMAPDESAGVIADRVKELEKGTR